MAEYDRTRRSASLRALLVSATFAGAALVAAPASAQALDERIWIEGSGFFPGIDTVVTVNRPQQPGTEINFEDDLDLDDTKTLPAVYGGWRFGERWVLAGEFYGLDRESSKSISRNIVFDGTTYPIGVTVTSAMKSNVYRATLGYSFIKNDRSELGAAIGIHSTDFELELIGDAQIGANTRQVVTRRREFLAPMPTVGLYGTYEATPKVILNGRVDFLSLDLDKYGGGITNVQASAAYRFNPSFSAGVAWRYVAYDLQVQRTDYDADIDYDFSGPSVFVRWGFR